MRRMWQPRSATTMLGAVLVAASLLVALTGTAQAQPSQHGTPAKQVARRGWATLTGYCYRTSTRVSAYMSIDSDEYGTGYANIYRRKSTGNVLVARGTRSGSRFYFINQTMSLPLVFALRQEIPLVTSDQVAELAREPGAVLLSIAKEGRAPAAAPAPFVETFTIGTGDRVLHAYQAAGTP